MNDIILNELEIAKQQLAVCKLQDRLLEKIEIKLFEMKKIAQYAADYELTLEERTDQNEQLNEHQVVIKSLKNLPLCTAQFRHYSDYHISA